MAEPLIVLVIRRYNPDWAPPPDTAKTWLQTCCPFHGDERASAAVSYEHNAFSCLACPVSGSAINLIKDREGVSYSTAVRLAKEISGGSYEPIPRKSDRVSRRVVFGEQRFVPSEPEGGEVPSRIRRKTFGGA